MTHRPNDPSFRTDVQKILRLAALAGGRAATAFHRPGATTTARIHYKDGGSPVTEADHAANAAILAILADSMPDAAIFSEEVADDGARFDRRRVVVIDPIDGTRAFIQGRDEWCVSIALLERGQPVAGVIHAPSRGETFEAALGQGAHLNGRRIAPRADCDATPRLAGPNGMLTALAARDPGFSAAPALRALAYRLAAVAAGHIDAALASGGAHDWDIAAAEVILSEVGCTVLGPDGKRPVYNAGNPVHPALVAAPESLARRLLPHLAAQTV